MLHNRRVLLSLLVVLCVVLRLVYTSLRRRRQRPLRRGCAENGTFEAEVGGSARAPPAYSVNDGHYVPRLLPIPRVTAALIPRIIVLDFDDTLVAVPVATLLQKPVGGNCALPADSASIFFDAEFFLEFCELASEQGHLLRVASHADDREAPAEMRRLMSLVLPSCRCYLTDLAHFACWRSNAGKNSHIARFIENAVVSGDGTYGTYQVVLIDDNSSNVRRANTSGYNAFCCSQGFTREWFSSQPRLQALLGIVM